MGFFQSRLEIRKLKKKAKQTSSVTDMIKVIDLQFRNLVLDQEIKFSGIYNDISYTTQAILLTNIKIDGVIWHNAFVVAEKDNAGVINIFITAPTIDYLVTINNNDYLTIRIY